MVVVILTEAMCRTCVQLTWHRKEKREKKRIHERMNEYIFLTLIMNASKKTWKKFKLSHELCRLCSKNVTHFFFGSRAYSRNRIHHTNLHTSKQWTNKFGMREREGERERNLSFVCGMKERIFYYAYGNTWECLCVCVHTVWAGKNTEYAKNVQHQKSTVNLPEKKIIVCGWELCACVRGVSFCFILLAIDTVNSTRSHRRWLKWTMSHKLFYLVSAIWITADLILDGFDGNRYHAAIHHDHHHHTTSP